MQDLISEERDVSRYVKPLQFAIRLVVDRDITLCSPKVRFLTLLAFDRAKSETFDFWYLLTGSRERTLNLTVFVRVIAI